MRIEDIVGGKPLNELTVEELLEARRKLKNTKVAKSQNPKRKKKSTSEGVVKLLKERGFSDEAINSVLEELANEQGISRPK